MAINNLYEALATYPQSGVSGTAVQAGLHYPPWGSVYYSVFEDSDRGGKLFFLNDHLTDIQRILAIRAEGRTFLYGDEADLATKGFFSVTPNPNPSNSLSQLFLKGSGGITTGLEWRIATPGTGLGFKIAEGIVLAAALVAGSYMIAGIAGGMGAGATVVAPTAAPVTGQIAADTTAAGFGESFTGSSFAIDTLSTPSLEAAGSLATPAASPSFWDTVTGALKTGAGDLKAVAGAAGAVKGISGGKAKTKTPGPSQGNVDGSIGLLALLGGGLLLLLVL